MKFAEQLRLKARNKESTLKAIELFSAVIRVLRMLADLVGEWPC
jgi:hypothetical protein